MRAHDFALDEKPRLVAWARLRWDAASGRHLLLSPERGLSLNASAAAILARCDGARTVARILEETVSALAAAEVARAVRETLAFLTDLRARGLVDAR